MSTSLRRRLGVIAGVSLLLCAAAAGQTPVPPVQQQQTQPVQQNTVAAAPNSAAAASSDSPEIMIGAGDLLEISVFGAPESLKQVRVSGDGTVTYPFAGNLKVAEMTVRQAEAALAQKLQQGGYYNNPTVSVLVKEFATQGISVLGEVQKPGIYPLLGPRQLFDAISAAGGLTPKAGKTVTVTHRARANEPQTVQFNDDPASNIRVYPGDTVMVSKAGIVYVVGNVHQPGGFVMENPELSVLQAVALAQGIMPDSSANNSKLIRKGPNGQQQEIPVRVKDVLASKAPDVKLQADDILFIPSSPGSSAAKKGLQAALQTLTGIAIYRHP